MRSTSVADRFVEQLDILRATPFSDRSQEQVRACLLDYLGATIVGANMLGDKAKRLLAALGAPGDDATIIGHGIRGNLERAVLLNGLSSHVAEMDDGVRFGMMHPGAPIFSALLPVAELERVSGSAFVSGVVTGYEAAIRLAKALQPSHYNRGFHPTGTCGSIGAAAGIAAMLGFTRRQLKDAISGAAVASHGTLKVLEDHSELKPANVGRAALGGLVAASMARAGFSGPDDVFSGPRSMCSMMADTCDLAPLTSEAKEPLAINTVYFKPYAACRHAHPSIEAVLYLRDHHALSLKSIKDIEITTYDSVMGKHDHAVVSTVQSAKMSIPFSVALALLTGRAGVEEFTSAALNDPQLNGLAQKVRISPDAELSAQVPEVRAAIVRIVLESGTECSTKVSYPKGEPENPMTTTELESKFLSLCRFARKAQEEAHGLADAVANLEQDLSALFPMLS